MKTLKDNLKYLILSLLTFCSLFNYIKIYVNDLIVKNILLIVLFILLFIFYKFLYKKVMLENKYKIFIIIASFIWTLGYSYEITTTSYLFFGTIFNFCISLIKMIGFYSFLKIVVYYLLLFLNKKYPKSKNKFIKQYEKHAFLYSFIFLFICYGILLVFFYPGIINYDNANQILEVFGRHTRYLDAINPISKSTLTNFNPIIHTLLLGGLVKFGNNLGSFNFGLFLYTFLQMLIVIVIYSYTLNYAIRKNINSKYVIAILLIIGFIPLFGFYSITAVKDTLYTSFLLLFSLKIYDFYNKDNVLIKDYINLFLTGMLVCLFRNNGIFIVMITIPFLAIKIRNKKSILVITLLIFLSCMTFNNVILPSLGISGTSIREALSIPFQQTARLAKEKNYPFSEKEAKIIDKILDYKNLAHDYNINLADPVKNKFNKDYTNQDLIKYFGVWAKGLVKYPNIYIDATINNVTGYFNPFVNSWKIYYKLNPNLPKSGFDYHYNNLTKERQFMHDLEIFVEATPIGLILNIALITWTSILIFISLINKKGNYIFLIPNIISILFCVLSPANTYYRYIYPSLVIMVLLFPLIKNIFEIKIH